MELGSGSGAIRNCEEMLKSARPSDGKWRPAVKREDEKFKRDLAEKAEAEKILHEPSVLFPEVSKPA
jgi:hypothetical protein